MLNERLKRIARQTMKERFALNPGWRLAQPPSRSAMLNETTRGAMLNWHRVERDALHCRAGDLLSGLLRAFCLTRVWSAMLDGTWWSAMLNTEAGDLLDHPFGALCSTKFDRSAMLY